MNTPAFPEYTSGHSTFSAAAAAVLAAFYGTDHISFTVGSDTLPGVFRTDESFETAAEKIGLSRIYGGIHFLSADLDGLEAGQRVGNCVTQNYLRPPPQAALLSSLHLLANGSMQLTLTGTASRGYVLEVSTNLVHWSPVFTNTAPFTFEDTVTSAVRFYRAVAVP